MSHQICYHLCHVGTFFTHQKVAKIVLLGKPSDRFGVVQEQMAESRQNYDMLKELLKDEEFRELSGKVMEMQMRLTERGAT